MEYVHCPACHAAYNLSRHGACPHCPPVDAVVQAAELLARALARATPAQIEAAREALFGVRAVIEERPMRALPAPVVVVPPRPIVVAVARRVASRIERSTRPLRSACLAAMQRAAWRSVT